MNSNHFFWRDTPWVIDRIDPMDELFKARLRFSMLVPEPIRGFHLGLTEPLPPSRDHLLYGLSIYKELIRRYRRYRRTRKGRHMKDTYRQLQRWNAVDRDVRDWITRELAKAPSPHP